MKPTLLLISLLFFACTNSKESSNPSYNIPSYHHSINKAELLICQEKYAHAADTYTSAFSAIGKPFGKDVFNAALACQLSNRPSERDEYLQLLIDNSDELEFIKRTFFGIYISVEDWQKLIDKRQIDYAPKLRREMAAIRERDQLFRPMYDTHDDTINTNRLINLKRINHLTDSIGFPAHYELGYTNYLRDQNHHIVLHHTAQRRSRDKSVVDLEPMLHKAVQEGRIDPEQAILYMSFQNDREKGSFEVYPIWQHKHPLLPDSLNNKLWLMNLDEEQSVRANEKRKEWLACQLEEIVIKADYRSKSQVPWIFTSVKKHIGNMREDMELEAALKQYRMATGFMKAYEKKGRGR